MPPAGINSLWDIDLAVDMLSTLHDGGLKAIPPLEKIVVIPGEYDINEEVVAFRETLTQRMPNSKWCIELKRVPPRVWISDDDMVEFDNHEDCCKYNDKKNLREWRGRRERSRSSERKSTTAGGITHIGRMIRKTIS